MPGRCSGSHHEPVFVRSEADLFPHVIAKGGFPKHVPKGSRPIVVVYSFGVRFPFGEEDGENNSALRTERAMKLSKVVCTFTERHVCEDGGQQHKVEGRIPEGKLERSGVNVAFVVVLG